MYSSNWWNSREEKNHNTVEEQGIDRIEIDGVKSWEESLNEENIDWLKEEINGVPGKWSGGSFGKRGE